MTNNSKCLQKENILTAMALGGIASLIVFCICLGLISITNGSLISSIMPTLLTFCFVGVIMYLKVSSQEEVLTQ